MWKFYTQPMAWNGESYMGWREAVSFALMLFANDLFHSLLPYLWAVHDAWLLGTVDICLHDSSYPHILRKHKIAPDRVSRFDYMEIAFILPSWLWLPHWDRVTHTCVSKIVIIVSDNGMSPGRRQAGIWTNAFPFDKMHLKMSSAQLRLFRLGFNEINVFLTRVI